MKDEAASAGARPSDQALMNRALSGHGPSGFDPSRGDFPKRVLVCGGRDFNDSRAVAAALDPLFNEGMTLIEGGARGADHQAKMWAVRRGVRVETYPADWERHGRGAGHIRNQQMLDEGKPDLVVALPGGRGTANMVERAFKAQVWTLDLRDSDGNPKDGDGTAPSQSDDSAGRQASPTPDSHAREGNGR